MKKKIKHIIKNIPLVAQGSKLFYDWNRERKLQQRVKNFIDNGNLPYQKESPKIYEVGYEPTIRCNLKCKMCYQGQTRSLRRQELTTEQSLVVFNKLKDGIKEIKLVGGEPFVREDIFELISFWDSLGKRVILQTNCTLLDEKAVSRIKNYKNVTDILTSLDGPPEVHDAIRGVPGTFSRFEKAVRMLKKERPDIQLTIFATLLINENVDQLFRLIDTCKDLGVGTVNILFEQVYLPENEQRARKIFKEILGWSDDSYRLNTQIRNQLFPDNLNFNKLVKTLSSLRSYGLKKNCFVNFVPFNYYKNLPQYLGLKPTRAFCLKLLSPELRINQEGKVIWCDIIEKSFGSLLEKTPAEIWLSADYQNFRQYLFKNTLPICQRCCKAIYI